MRKLLIRAFIAGAALAGGYAVAQIVPALPFQLQNNTVANATQVMANFNQLLNSVNANAAKNGSNNDITALLGLSTPIAPSVGGTTVYTGGTASGTNLLTVAAVVPSTFTLALGTRVVFVAGADNTGGLTLNVSGSGAKNIYRPTQLGPRPTAGGEFKTGAVIEVIYDGTQYQIVAPMVYVGTIMDYMNSGVPGGTLVADGSCVVQATFPTLFEVLGTAWGSCGAGSFALPDLRGRTTFSADAGANRITNAGSGCTATLATGCGAQNSTVGQTNLPNVNFTLSINDTRTWATSSTVLPGGAATAPGAGGITGLAAQTVGVVVTGGTIGGTAASGGSGTALPTLNPALIVNKVIKY